MFLIKENIISNTFVTLSLSKCFLSNDKTLRPPEASTLKVPRSSAPERTFAFCQNELVWSGEIWENLKLIVN